MHQVLLRLDRGHRGGDRALRTIRRRFVEWEEGDHAKLLADWCRDTDRCRGMDRPQRDEARTVAYAVRLVEDGSVAKAMRLLESQGLGDINVPRIRDQMAAKHPQTREDWDHDLTGVERVDLTQVDKGLTLLRRHAGTGVDRFPFEFLFRIKRGVMPAPVRAAALSGMTNVGNRIVNCDMPGWFYVLWTIPLLFAPYKDEAMIDCRPVACGNSRRRFYGRCHALDYVDVTKRDAEPVQLGSATPAGVQVMGVGLHVHFSVFKLVQLMIKCDFKNSFNLVERAVIMGAGRGRLPTMHRYWEAESRPRSPIFIADRHGHLVQAPFDSVQGTQQGSEYGAKGHNAAYQPLFDELNAFLQMHGGIVRADCDDCVICAPPALAVEAFRRLAAGARERGGQLQPTKSKAYALDVVKDAMVDAGVVLPEGVAWGTNSDADGAEAFGMVVAGTPIGDPLFVLNHVTTTVQNVLATTTTVMDKLLSVSSNDHALQCVRLSLRSRVNFLQQVVVPTPAIMEQYRLLDEGLDAATAAAMGIDLLHLAGTPAAAGLADPTLVSQRAALPGRLGGTGHRRMDFVSAAAYIGSMAMVIPRLPDRVTPDGDAAVGLFAHLACVVGTGPDFQRKYEGSGRFAQFLAQSEAIGIDLGIMLRQLWQEVRAEVGDPEDGVMSVDAEDLPGPPETGLPVGSPDSDVIFTKLQREVTRARENFRHEDLGKRFALLPRADPGRVAFKANAPSVSFISLPSADLGFSPRELTTALALSFGVPDPGLTDVVGVEYMDGQHRRVIDAFGYSLSLYTGLGTRRTTTHDILGRRIESLLHFAGGQNCVERERKGVFAGCIADLNRRRAYMQAEGSHTRKDACGLRPDLAADRWQWAQSPSGPSKLQLWDVKTMGMRPTYEGNYRIRPVDQRASRVPPAYRLLAAKADVKWNRLAPDSGGPFQRYLASLPPVIGLAFGACSEWPQSVDRLIGQTAELGSKCPERFVCFMGRDRRSWCRTGLRVGCAR